jgi:hypothetical protein
MSNERHTFWDQLYKNGKLTQKLFSLCFSRSDSIEYEGTGAGAMTVGGSNQVLHKTPMVYAKELKGRGFFTVHVKKIFLRKGGGQSAAFEPTQTGNDMIALDITEETLNNRGVIFDSGTTDTYLTRELAASFKKEWKTLTGQNYANKPISMTQEELKQLPTIIVQLQGVDASYYQNEHQNSNNEVEPQHMVGLAGEMEPDAPFDVYLAIPATHFFEYDEDKNAYTPRIYLDERSGSVLGANAMQGHDVFFNMEDQVIGIAESDCDFLALNIPGGTHGDQSSKMAVESVPENNQEDDEEGHTRDPYYSDTSTISSYMMGTDENGDAQFTCDSMACKGLLGVGGLMFIVGMVLGVPAMKRWRTSRANYTVHHALEGQEEQPHEANYSDNVETDLDNLDEDDDMSDHEYGVENMTADRRSIV